MAAVDGFRNRRTESNYKPRVADEGKLLLFVWKCVWQRADEEGEAGSGVTSESVYVSVVFVSVSQRAFPLARRFCFQLETRDVLPNVVPLPGRVSQTPRARPEVCEIYVPWNAGY